MLPFGFRFRFGVLTPPIGLRPSLNTEHCSSRLLLHHGPSCLCGLPLQPYATVAALTTLTIPQQAHDGIINRKQSRRVIADSGCVWYASTGFDNFLLLERQTGGDVMQTRVRGSAKDRAKASILKWLKKEGLQGGDRLPSQAQLATELGCSGATVHAALTVLSREGLVRRKVGDGTYLVERERQHAAQRNVADVALPADRMAARPQLTGPLVIASQALMSPVGGANPVNITIQAMEREARLCFGEEVCIAHRRFATAAEAMNHLQHDGAKAAAFFWNEGAPEEEMEDLELQAAREDVSVFHAHFESPGRPHVHRRLSLSGEAIGRLAAQHLLDRGHRRLYIAHSGADMSFERLRIAGFERAVQRVADTTLERSLGKRPSRSRTWNQWGEEVADHFLDGSKRPTAIFCLNDEMAEALGSALLARDVTIPQEVSLLGVDNLRPHHLSDRIVLSTIDPGFHTLGVEAIRQLARDLEQGGQVRHDMEIRICPLLVLRDSTGPK